MDNKTFRLNSFKFSKCGGDSPIKLQDSSEISRSKDKKNTFSKNYYNRNVVKKESSDSIESPKELIDAGKKRTRGRFVTVNFVKKGTILGGKRPETTIDKIIKIMKKIKEKLIFYKELDLVEETEWIVREVMNDNIYKFNVNDDISSKMDREFYNNYSNFKMNENIFNDKSNADKSDSNNNICTVLGYKRLNSSKSLIDFDLVNSDLGPKFDIFKFSEEVGKENVLGKITNFCFGYKNVSQLLDKENLDDYIEEIRQGYSMNQPAKYHTDLHAADVIQTIFHFCYKGIFDQILHLDNLDILSLLFSSLIHDYKHPGYSNMFLINSKDDIAYKYNGKKFFLNNFRYFSFGKFSCFRGI